MAILEVSHIEKHFGRTNVLKDVSFSMEEGTALAIIGSSGSGKTTLLRCLNFWSVRMAERLRLMERHCLMHQQLEWKRCGSAQKTSAFWHGVSVIQSVSTVYSVTECDACGTASGTGTSGFQTE